MIALAALVVSLAVPAAFASPARADSSWCDNDLNGGIYHEYAGYEYDYIQGTQVPLGGGPSGTVTLESDTLVSGQEAGWVGVTMGNGSWVQAGVLIDNNGPHIYTEWNNGNEYKTVGAEADLIGVPENIQIIRETTNSSGGASSWTVLVNGIDVLNTPMFSGKGTTIDYTGEYQDLPGYNACTAGDFRFTSVNRAVSNMTLQLGVGSPAYTTNVGTNSWDSVEPHLTR